MRTLERYLFREVLQSWAAVTLVLLVILLSNQLATVLSRAADGGYSGSVVLVLLWLAAIQQLVDLIPLGLFLGIMLALGRLYHESELTAMQACGLDNRRLFKPVALLALIAAALLAWLALVVAPAASERAVELRGQAVREARFASLQPGKFRSFGGATGVVFYAESADEQGMLYNVYAERSVGEQLEIWTAKRAIQQGIGERQQTFVLYDGVRYEGIPGAGEFRTIEFKEGGLPVTLPDAGGNSDRVDMRPTRQLLMSNQSEDIAELHMRLAQPIMALMFACVGVPLARLRPRQGRYAKAGAFIGMYLLYRGALMFADNLLLVGKLPSLAGLWWVHAIVGVVAMWLWQGRSVRVFLLQRSQRA